MTDIFICPHCKEPVIIEKLNCGIFRHGMMKSTGKQVHPHTNKSKCEKLVKNNLIYGCGKPFRIILTDEFKLEIQICDYI